MRNPLLTGFVLATALAVTSPARADVGTWFHERPKSPYRLVPLVDVSILLVSLSAWLGSYYSQNALSPPTCGQPGNLCDRSAVPWFDRPFMYSNRSLSEPASFLFTWGPLITAGGLFIDYGPFRVGGYFTDLTLGLESMAVSGMVTHAFRFGVRRPRPYLYIPDVYSDRRGSADATMSFWSGHVSEFLAFGVTMSWIFTLRHGVRSPWTWVMWTAMAGTATVIGILRVGSGEHFLSDVVAGAAVGTGVGLLVPILHPRSDGAIAQALRSIRPVVAPDYQGLSVLVNL